MEDHLGAALIEHGDSVIVKREVLSQVMGQDKQGGTAYITSHALPLAVYGTFFNRNKKGDYNENYIEGWLSKGVQRGKKRL